ncbi:MAG: bifunctional DNA-formamidopyrimidine glycosylase/DNA-(apurinic or apyrimidinic site) lyase [Betaproteobacteria bacterium]|nr:bifunctional DNA-formamidopyrimidine glycosylase/DNA-(apurinic or apyrimidinic site) lyase [Betaproteobacteria bacterium]MBA3776320.1 bifunctional DNA-formamidopyrimidine glycosylase/DNA-(apurinic or apyrimidinic site) lyase [Betaproteobacteria bacterium]
MPELPEVETTRRGVAARVVGRRIVDLQVYDSRLRWPVPIDLKDRLKGYIVDALERRSKYLLFSIGTGALLVHLGMTGSLRVYTQPPPRVRHDHVDVVFDDDAVLRYHDPRRFGAMLWAPFPATAHPLLQSLGPEPFDPVFDGDYLWRSTRARTAAIKLALMDSRLVVGVGNIYANEALFRAAIRPATPAWRVSRSRLSRLVAEVRAVLTEAIAKGGSTLRDYVDAGGEPGYFQLNYYVYARTGEPCRICGSVIRHMRLGARSSFYCPNCQRP